jgi:hypothetical protein
MNLFDLVQEYGVKNLVFCIPMRPLEFAGFIPGIAFKTSTSEEVVVPARIDESRYKISQGYKITLRADDPAYGREHFYICDLESLFRDCRRAKDNRYRCFVETIDGLTEVVID